jgi:hypothetical protein
MLIHIRGADRQRTDEQQRRLPTVPRQAGTAASIEVDRRRE